MTLEWHGDAVMKGIREQAAKQLLAAGKMLQNEDRKRRGIVDRNRIVRQRLAEHTRNSGRVRGVRGS